MMSPVEPIVLIRSVIWASLAALGFAVLFNVPKKALLGCLLCGACGYTVRTILDLQFNVYIGVATLIGATCIGFLGINFARYWKMPTTIFTVSGAIPLVPGVFAYRTMLGILAIADLQTKAEPALVMETMTNAINTAFILGGIALGIIAPKLILLRLKPIV